MKISVITPSFNQGLYIERTIQSVIKQDLGDHALEYIVMDGGSTDQTVSILKKYEHSLLWISEPDQGQAHAVNKGLQKASGDVIGWLNSDDIYYAQSIKIICDYFAKHPEIDVIYADAYLIDCDDHKIGLYPTETFNLDRLKSRCFLSQPATFFRRSAVIKYGLLNEALHFCMDYEYWLRLGLKGAKFVYLPVVLAGARMYADTKSSRSCMEASLEAIDVVQNKLGYIPAAWVVSFAGARTKAESGAAYPGLSFIFLTWLKLWNVTGDYYQGMPRFVMWCSAQFSMTKEFLRRSISLIKMKSRYNALGANEKRV